MNTTKLLYQRFDERNKGYVTVGDVLKHIPVFLASVLVMGTYLYGMHNAYKCSLTDCIIPSTYIEYFTEFITIISIVVTIVIIFLIMLFLIIDLCVIIKNIKIVSYEQGGGPKDSK